MPETAAQIGDNRPPVDFFPTREQLDYDNAELLARASSLIEAAGRVPPITDEDIARRVSDFIAQMMAALKSAEAARQKAKSPYLEGARAIDGYFHDVSGPLTNARRNIENRLTVWLRAKADRERAERQERERIARAEEDRRRAEALAAETQARDEQTLAAAVEAERLARQAEADRIAAGRAAQANAAELSRVRGEFGAVGSLRTSWTFDDLDRGALDLERLRQHLSMAALESAVRSYIKAGGRELSGCRIFETTSAAVR